MIHTQATNFYFDTFRFIPRKRSYSWLTHAFVSACMHKCAASGEILRLNTLKLILQWSWWTRCWCSIQSCCTVASGSRLVSAAARLFTTSRTGTTVLRTRVRATADPEARCTSLRNLNTLYHFPHKYCFVSVWTIQNDTILRQKNICI